MKVVIISGSVRTGRQSQKAAQYLEKELIGRGIGTEIIDLAERMARRLEDAGLLDPVLREEPGQSDRRRALG